MSSEEETIEVKIIGITGVIGSGKSTVSGFIEEMSYPLISSDEVAKELMRSDAGLIQEIKLALGTDVYDGNIPNSKKISKLIFSDNKDAKIYRDKLNSLVHPRVLDENMRRIEEFASNGEQIIFVESALIFEIGMEEGYDYIICVDAGAKTSLQRASLRLGISQEQVQLRMNTQFSATEKKKGSDFVIDNSGSLEKTKQATQFVADLIKTLPPKKFTE